MFMMRFDLRAPAHGAPAADLYAAALDMAAWAEDRGCIAVVLSEHHASPDGYLPTPTVVASAIAARTKSVPIIIAAALLPLYEPVRLAEEMIVLDLVSRGRVSYVFGLGYRPEEFQSFGVERADRVRLVEHNLDIVLHALREGTFVREGRTICVTPAPYTPGGPTIAYGGGSVAAARRAARFGLDFFAQSNAPGLREAYQGEAARVGHEPGNCMLPDPNLPVTTFVADDVDKAWDELGPYLLHDATTYAAWNPDDVHTVSLSRGTTVEELRAEHGQHRIFAVDEAVDHVRKNGFLSLHPLCGGVPPAVAWPYLERVAASVLPAASQAPGLVTDPPVPGGE
jgi:alkanesulfonate monooxygenase SsuD/methylene tetrahydromethanopterin reductase-like flavin-dependent oxidoreductase (luciferase family)